MKDRLKKLRLTLKLSQKEFGEQIGLKTSAISYLESGKSNLTESNAKLICNIFHVNYDWLINGNGQMFEDEQAGSLNRLAIEYNLTESEKNA